MKSLLVIAVILIGLNETASAAVYEGKKFKVTIGKDKETGQRTVEGEVWDTTKSEHLLIIKTQPETPSKTENKMLDWNKPPVK